MPLHETGWVQKKPGPDAQICISLARGINPRPNSAIMKKLLFLLATLLSPSAVLPVMAMQSPPLLCVIADACPGTPEGSPDLLAGQMRRMTDV